MTRLGLREMLAAVEGKPICPFCGEPRKERKAQKRPFNSLPSPQRAQGRKSPHAPPGYYLTCGDQVCQDAYTNYWRIDARRRNRERKVHLSVPSATRLAS